MNSIKFSRAKHRATDSIIARATQQMRQTAVPPDGVAQTLARIHTLSPERALPAGVSFGPVTQRRRTGRLVGGAVALAAASIALLLILPFLPVKRSLAAEVQAALSSVNSWHLSGWKIVDGKRVKWEVWGRRSPFFYREQVGRQTIWDDGKVRYQTFASDAGLGRPVGLTLKTASRPTENSLGWRWIHSFAAWNRNSKPWKETNDQLLFMNHDAGMQGPDSVSDNIYTIDKRTMLPSDVTVQRGKYGNATRTTAERLHASYDVPLPDAVTALPLGEDLLLVNATIDTSGIGVSQEVQAGLQQGNAVSQNGLTVQATPLAVDAKGCVLIRLRAWLGTTEVKMDGKPFVWGASAVRSEGVPAVDPPACYDEMGRTYLSVDSELLAFSNSGILMLLAPLEPLPDGAVSPKHLNLLLRVNPQMTVRLSASEIGSAPLMTEKVHLSLSLPQPIPTLNLKRYQSKVQRSRSSDSKPFSLPSDTAWARANFYRDGYRFEGRVQSKIKTSRSYWKATQGARWGEEAVALASAHSNQAQFLRLDVANTYGWIGNYERKEKILQEVVDESNCFPTLDPYYRRMAERILRGNHKRSASE